MTPAEQRVHELVDKWLQSLELHLEYAALGDEAYWRVQPWVPHQRPARWILELAHARASDLKHQLHGRSASGDTGFAEAVELMAFLSNLVGVQQVERFIPLADPAREIQHEIAAEAPGVAVASLTTAAIAIDEACAAAEPAAGDVVEESESAADGEADGEGPAAIAAEGAAHADGPADAHGPAETCAADPVRGVPEDEPAVAAAADPEADEADEADEHDDAADAANAVDVYTCADAVPEDCIAGEAVADDDAESEPDAVLQGDAAPEMDDDSSPAAVARPAANEQPVAAHTALPVMNAPDWDSAAQMERPENTAPGAPVRLAAGGEEHAPASPPALFAMPTFTMNVTINPGVSNWAGLAGWTPASVVQRTPPAGATAHGMAPAAPAVARDEPEPAVLHPGGASRVSVPADAPPAAPAPTAAPTSAPDATAAATPGPAAALAPATAPTSAPTPPAATSAPPRAPALPVPPPRPYVASPPLSLAALEARLAQPRTLVRAAQPAPGAVPPGPTPAPVPPAPMPAPVQSAATAPAFVPTPPPTPAPAFVPAPSFTSTSSTGPPAASFAAGTPQIGVRSPAPLPPENPPWNDETRRSLALRMSAPAGLPGAATARADHVPVLDTPRGANGKAKKGGKGAGTANAPAPDASPDEVVIADAVRLLKWGKEWHELAEAIARMAGRPTVVDVRKMLRAHKTDIQKQARH